MNLRREYEIAFVGLKTGIHEYEYEVDDKFFTHFGEQDFNNINALVKLTLDKHQGFLQLKFEVDGTLETNCDRCGNDLHVTLWDEFNIVVKLVDEPEKMNEEEDDPDVYYISHTESHLHLEDWIYEFINLSIPMQNICGTDEKGNSKCDKKALEKLKQMEDEAAKTAMPVWKGLEQFKDLQ